MNGSLLRNKYGQVCAWRRRGRTFCFSPWQSIRQGLYGVHVFSFFPEIQRNTVSLTKKCRTDFRVREKFFRLREKIPSGRNFLTILTPF